jgi:hypothetical protein
VAPNYEIKLSNENKEGLLKDYNKWQEIINVDENVAPNYEIKL